MTTPGPTIPRAAALLATFAMACSGTPPAYDRLTVSSEMTEPRAGHSATLLDDGTVLLVGGGRYSMERYDPDTGAFEAQPFGQLKERLPIRDHSAVLVDDGVVLIAGTDPAFARGVIMEFDAGEGALEYLKVAGLDGSIKSIERGPHKALSRGLGDVLYVCGTTRAPYPGYPECTVHELEYRPGETSRLRCLPGLPAADYTMGCDAQFLDERQVLLVGGRADYDHDSPAVDFVELYDLDANGYRAVGPMAAPRGPGSAAVTLDDGRVLLVGDSDAPVELLELETESFTAVSLDDLPRFRHATATRLDDGRVLISGGRVGDSGPALSQALVFDPTDDTLSRMPFELPSPRSMHAATRLDDGRVLLTGGLTLEPGTGASEYALAESLIVE